MSRGGSGRELGKRLNKRISDFGSFGSSADITKIQEQGWLVRLPSVDSYGSWEEIRVAAI